MKAYDDADRIDFDQRFENLDRFFVFARHEIAFAERGAQIGALGGKLDAGFEQRDRVFEIVLRHADAREQEDDVGIFGRGFVGADEEIERVGRFSLAKINFGEQILRLGRIGTELQRAIEREFGVGVFCRCGCRFARAGRGCRRCRALSALAFSSSSCAALYCLLVASTTPSCV